jgi:hypothetical protein
LLVEQLRKKPVLLKIMTRVCVDKQTGTITAIKKSWITGTCFDSCQAAGYGKVAAQSWKDAGSTLLASGTSLRDSIHLSDADIGNSLFSLHKDHRSGLAAEINAAQTEGRKI